ncbi:DUF1931 family protein [Streptomyces sp. RB6PN25]|uniref:DUF1931 family protein n=1 Tax=Streptomyces humicola TaxID=2953240 RepID=A0ABT1PNS4_9ACTN|nr:DUF1931 family protein [Streptomyces humicola]MCQ4079321.1 DUF1931 family protein [Streptomyces humicola]
MPFMGVTKFERFFRAAAGLAVDKNDLKRYADFIDQKIYDLFLVGEAAAKASGRDIIEPHDLPITKGLQESIHAFKELDQQIELQPLLDQLAAHPALDVAISDQTKQRLPAIAGGLSVAMAQSFRIIAPDRRHPLTPEWEQVLSLFDLLL